MEPEHQPTWFIVSLLPLKMWQLHLTSCCPVVSVSSPLTRLNSLTSLCSFLCNFSLYVHLVSKTQGKSAWLCYPASSFTQSGISKKRCHMLQATFTGLVSDACYHHSIFKIFVSEYVYSLLLIFLQQKVL